MECLRCKKQHEGNFGSGKYCSRKCANSRGPRTEEFKSLMSSKLKGRAPSNKGKEMKPRLTKICPTCNKQFNVTEKADKIYCCGKCNPEWGGFRQKSGRAKIGYYKGIYCGSSYELVWVIHSLDHNIKFERFSHTLKTNEGSYIPDFLIDNTIIEIKGFEDVEQVQRKTRIALQHGYNVQILRRSDLEEHFEWVRQNYTYKNIEELYDDYKPKFVYECCNCGSSVNRQKQSKTAVIFCSRKCAGIQRTKINRLSNNASDCLSKRRAADNRL